MIHRVGMIALMAATLMAFGCSSSKKSSSSTSCVTAPTPGAACTGGQTYVYVVSGLDLPIDTSTTPATFPGFNLDCNTSATCGQGGEPIQDGQWMGTDGIDNGLAAGPLGQLVPTLLNQSLKPAILDGSALVLVRLEHVDSLTNDDCVDLSLLVGQVPAAYASNPQAYIDANSDGTIDSGLTIDVNPSSYDGSGNPISSAQASIANGKIVAVPSILALNLGSFTLQVPTSEVSFDVSSNALSSGILGGVLPVTDFANAIAGLINMNPADLASSLLPYADMSSSDNNCDSMSLGVTFTAVNAVVGNDPRGTSDGGVPDGGTIDAGPSDGGTDGG